MKLWIPKNRKELKQHLNDPLYKNSIFLIASSILGAGFGFFFWLIAARLYSAEDIGLASAMISAVMLLHLFSLMGFEFSLTHYLPIDKGNKNELINSCLTIVLLVSSLLAFIFLIGLDVLSPALICIKENNILLLFFIIFTIFTSLTSLQTFGIFVGLRKAKYSFIQNVISSLSRIVALIFLIAFGAYGIFTSFGLATFIAFVAGLILTIKILPSYVPIPTIKRGVINEVFHYSLSNYIAKIFSALPNYVLPILVVNTLGFEQNAYFYIAWAISSVLLAIPRWTSLSLLAEGSCNPEKIRRDAFRSLKFIFLLLTPAIIGIFVFGEYVLWLFGEEYARNSFKILLILCIASIPFSFNAVYLTVKRVREELKTVIFVYCFVAIFTLLGGYLSVQSMGLIGIGFTWLLAQSIVAMIIGINITKKQSKHGLFDKFHDFFCI
jgi:O-antigen/teichoic acid export membrane protein